MTIKTILAATGIALAMSGCSRNVATREQTTSQPNTNASAAGRKAAPVPAEATPHVRPVDFSQYNPVFRFSAEIPARFDIEYVPSIQALNIHDLSDPAGTVRDKSQIFIRFFDASRFLTLNTVDILSREATAVNGHDAVRYEIEKKAGVPPFPDQPVWRNERHKLIDIRFTKSSPSVFYVFSYNPALPQETFDAFIASLAFHNDRQSFTVPVDRARERVTKKPFGIKIDPATSPVQPERFSGYHSGTDFEIFDGELSDVADERKTMKVNAICGGKLLQKKYAGGYGGVAVQECLINEQPVTVVYGHLRLASIVNEGSYRAPGFPIGELGDANSKETDGERMHLHLGIHKGKTIDIRGYVPTAAELSAWIDPLTVIP